MFRVNQTEWINPRLKGVEHVRIIPCQNNAEEDCFYVDIIIVRSTLTPSSTPKITLKI